MTNRFARAHFQPHSDYAGVVTVKVGNGDYFELTALDRYHAETKLHEFARANHLILIECSGFSKGSRTVSDGGDNAGRTIVSPIAAPHSPSSQSQRNVRNNQEI